MEELVAEEAEVGHGRGVASSSQKLSYSQQDALGTDTLIARITGDVNQVQSGLNLALRLLL
ncbi:MAG: hypothetical protein IIY74_02745, partial [Firmicutes bacterium]|nr:hypothetical protein [Bacillota bacterium]